MLSSWQAKNYLAFILRSHTLGKSSFHLYSDLRLSWSINVDWQDQNMPRTNSKKVFASLHASITQQQSAKYYVAYEAKLGLSKWKTKVKEHTAIQLYG